MRDAPEVRNHILVDTTEESLGTSIIIPIVSLMKE